MLAMRVRIACASAPLAAATRASISATPTWPRRMDVRGAPAPRMLSLENTENLAGRELSRPLHTEWEGRVPGGAADLAAIGKAASVPRDAGGRQRPKSRRMR